LSTLIIVNSLEPIADESNRKVLIADEEIFKLFKRRWDIEVFFNSFSESDYYFYPLQR